MKLISWNVHELGSSRAVRRLQQVLRLHKPQVIFFMETKLNRIRMERFEDVVAFLTASILM